MLFKHRQQKGIYKPEQTASLAKDELSLSELKDSGIAVHRMLAIASSCSWFSAWFEVVSSLVAISPASFPFFSCCDGLEGLSACSGYVVSCARKKFLL